MIANLATYASPKLGHTGQAPAAPSRAVAAVPDSPRPKDPPPRPAPMSAASTVALAPAAMSALIEAQEHMASSASVLERVQTAEKIDRLISRLGEGDPPPPPVAGEPLTVRRLQTARALLS